ncbi:hypothetical protein BCO18175_07308 [Burkholderia contaminans]|uniref:hypothetical protein n=1 Tax=Burkholderia contaminans TaxID=488447 RepID=UPI0014544769|nr:hypothetical protein [Burkholderia contaminans]VWD46841.1 hypothetical protein BCO18175_07308 [Burkholderia contaminans]
MGEAVRTEDVTAAQPTFSSEELEALFRELDLPGDPRNEADRQLLVDALIEVEQTAGDSFATLYAQASVTPAPPPAEASLLAGPGKFTPIRRARSTAIDATILEDVPTTGKELSRAAVDLLSKKVHLGRSTVTGGIIRGAVPRLEPTGAHDLDVFIVEASRALPFKRPSFIERVLDVVRGGSESRWRTTRHGVNVDLHHGSRHWYMTFVFHKAYVLVTVAGGDKDLLKRQVDSSKPDELSKALLTALDGDVWSTQLALDTVQKGLTSGAVEILH